MTTLRHDATPIGCNLRKLRHFEDVPAGTLDALRGMCRPQSYRAGQTVAPGGETAGFVGGVTSGFLRMQKTLPDGRQHIVGLLVAGDLFAPNPNFAIEAATDAELQIFHRSQFAALMRRSEELEKIVNLNLINELDRARDWLLILSNQRVRCRLAGFLVLLCTRYAGVEHVLRTEGGALELRIPISRVDLSGLLGTRPESLSRAFHSLADDGIIDILKPDQLRILDFDALAGEAGDGGLAASLTREPTLPQSARR